jgi:hypothetical protein
LQKRREKFGATGSINFNEDKALLDKRKEKFGANNVLSSQA